MMTMTTPTMPDATVQPLRQHIANKKGTGQKHIAILTATARQVAK